MTTNQSTHTNNNRTTYKAIVQTFILILLIFILCIQANTWGREHAEETILNNLRISENENGVITVVYGMRCSMYHRDDYMNYAQKYDDWLKSE